METEETKKPGRKEEDKDLLPGGGGVTVENGRECFYCLNVIGQIEGHYQMIIYNDSYLNYHLHQKYHL